VNNLSPVRWSSGLNN